MWMHLIVSARIMFNIFLIILETMYSAIEHYVNTALYKCCILFIIIIIIWKVVSWCNEL